MKCILVGKAGVDPAMQQDLTNHINNKNNPHETKAYVVAATAPAANDKQLYVNSQGVLHYYNGSAWTPVASTWA